MEITRDEAAAIVAMALTILIKYERVTGAANDLLIRIEKEWPKMVEPHRKDLWP